MFGSQGLLAGRDLYHITSAVTQGLGFSGLIRRTAPSVASYATQGDVEDIFEPGSLRVIDFVVFEEYALI
jgi:hypothetical protein